MDRDKTIGVQFTFYNNNTETKERLDFPAAQRDSVKDAPPREAEKPSVLNRIAADRAERAAVPERGTPEKPRKSQGEER